MADKKTGDGSRRSKPTGSPFEDALSDFASLSPGTLAPFADPDGTPNVFADRPPWPKEPRHGAWIGLRPPMTARQLGLTPGTFDDDPYYRRAYTEGIILREDAATEGGPEILVVKSGSKSPAVLAKYVQIKHRGAELKILQEYDPMLDRVVVLAMPEEKKKLIEFGFGVHQFDPKAFP